MGAVLTPGAGLGTRRSSVPPRARQPKHGRTLCRLLDVGYAAIWNLLHMPATVVRVGTDRHGLPLAVQVRREPPRHAGSR